MGTQDSLARRLTQGHASGRVSTKATGKTQQVGLGSNTPEGMPSNAAAVSVGSIPAQGDHAMGGAGSGRIQPLEHVELRPLIDEYIAQAKKAGQAANSIANKELWLGKLLRFQFADEMTVSRPGHKGSVQLLVDELAQHYSPASMEQCRTVWRAFDRWLTPPTDSNLHGQDYLRRSFLIRVTWPKNKHEEPTLPTADEVRIMLTACTDSNRGKKDAAVLWCLLDLGCRDGEMGENVNTAGRYLRMRDRDGWRFSIADGKTASAKRTAVLVNQEARAAFDVYMATLSDAERHPDQPMFPTGSGKPISVRQIQRIIERLSAQLPEDRRPHPHLLRHLFRTNLDRVGMPNEYKDRLLGHKPKGSTGATTYSHLTPDDIERVAVQYQATARFLSGDYSTTAPQTATAAPLAAPTLPLPMGGGQDIPACDHSGKHFMAKGIEYCAVCKERVA
jgi:integrase